ncbi:MAG: AAA family ATPase [Peptococcaceae bacterium]|nr:AAA family ATPase [Peptococcaceae bacterium]
MGHTADKTAQKIESALGGVLFIDEAYSLFTDCSFDYGHEAVATLVKTMEDKRHEFVCILAGYTKEMNAMLNMNPGLRDRVQFTIEFPDYSETELLQIFEKLCEENKYRLTASAKSALQTGFAHLVRTKSQHFSNGRLARKVFERARMKQAIRSSGSVMTDADIQNAFAEKDIDSQSLTGKTCPIGFHA